MDAVGQILLQRVVELLATRSEMERAEFGRRIGRGHSWISEFFAGLRTSNDLRLIVRMSRVFGVSVGYLLGETEREPLDPGAATLLATWTASGPADRELLLTIAASLRQRVADSTEPTAGSSDAAPGEERGRKRARVDEPPKRKR